MHGQTQIIFPETCFEVKENKEGELKICYKRIHINEELKEQEQS